VQLFSISFPSVLVKSSPEAMASPQCCWTEIGERNDISQYLSKSHPVDEAILEMIADQSHCSDSCRQAESDAWERMDMRFVASSADLSTSFCHFHLCDHFSAIDLAPLCLSDDFGTELSNGPWLFKKED
jgi:hypothetical protein